MSSALRALSLRLGAELVLPVERYLTKRVIVQATEEIEGLPLHALLTAKGGPVSDLHDISYAPFLGAPSMQPDTRPLSSLVIFGAPSARPIENEYALRSIKNFYRDPMLFVTQSATEKNFLSVSGSVLHLATDFASDEETTRGSFALSGGSITSPDVYFPLSHFLMTRPFRVWVLAEQRRDTCSLTMQHAVFALMSGATQVVVQRMPGPATYTKSFNEFFYTALSGGNDAKKAYAEALALMGKNSERNKAYSSAVFYFVEW